MSVSGHRVLHSQQIGDDPSQWSSAIDGGVVVGPGTTMQLLHAAVIKPGSDAANAVDAIEVVQDEAYLLRPCVGYMFSGQAERSDGLTLSTSSIAKSFDKYYITDTDSEQFHQLTVPIRVSKGVYSPGELAQLITQQTRSPIGSDLSPAGTIRGPCVQTFGSIAAPYSGGLDNPVNPQFFQVTSAPITAAVKSQFADGISIGTHWRDPNGELLYNIGVVNSPMDDGGIFGMTVIAKNGVGAYVFEPFVATNVALRTVADSATPEAVPTSRLTYGCTTGVSFSYDTVMGKFQMSSHSPLYSLNPAQAADVVVVIDNDNTDAPRVSGIGARGLLAWPDSSWGASKLEWESTVWYKMGFDYDVLNGTPISSPAGWVTSDAYIDTSFDIQQSNTVVPLPIEYLSIKNTGPVGRSIANIPIGETAYWLIECSLLSHASGRWTSFDGNASSNIIGYCPRTFASNNAFQSDSGPVWEVAQGTEVFTATQYRIVIRDATTGLPDKNIGDGSSVLIEIR